MSPDNKLTPSSFQCFDVFISYSRDDYFQDGDIKKGIIDNNIVIQLTNAFKENNITYWIDLEGIGFGEDYADKLVTNIDNSKTFLFILTENANNSQDVRKEIKVAVDTGKTIIPVFIDGTKPNNAIRYHVSGLTYYECNYSQHCDFRKLTHFIKNELQKQEKLHQIYTVEKKIQDISNSIQEKKKEINQLTDHLNADTKELEQIKRQLACLNNEESQVYPPKGFKRNKTNGTFPKFIKDRWFLSLLAGFLVIAAIFLWTIMGKSKSLEQNLASIIEDYSSEVNSLTPLYENFKQGDKNASLLLGKTILDSLNGNKAKNVGQLLIQKAANEDLAEAQNLMGTMFYLGKNGFQEDYDSASYWFNKAIENNSLEALRNMGEAYADGKYKGKKKADPKRNEAITLLRQASIRGDSKSMVRLGRLYYNILDSINKYPQKADKMNEENDSSKYWMTRALEDPYLQPSLRSDAQYFIGMYYYQKYILDKDDYSKGKQSMEWFILSSKNKESHPYSNYYIGRLYEMLEEDEKMAAHYYEIAAHNGVIEAKKRLQKLGLPTQ